MSALEERTGPSAGREARPAYHRIEELLAAERCVILDGGIATELGSRLPGSDRGQDEALWGTWALVHDADVVRERVAVDDRQLPNLLLLDEPQGIDQRRIRADRRQVAYRNAKPALG